MGVALPLVAWFLACILLFGVFFGCGLIYQKCRTTSSRPAEYRFTWPANDAEQESKAPANGSLKSWWLSLFEEDDYIGAEPGLLGRIKTWFKFTSPSGSTIPLSSAAPPIVKPWIPLSELRARCIALLPEPIPALMVTSPSGSSLTIPSWESLPDFRWTSPRRPTEVGYQDRRFLTIIPWIQWMKEFQRGTDSLPNPLRGLYLWKAPSSTTKTMDDSSGVLSEAEDPTVDPLVATTVTGPVPSSNTSTADCDDQQTHQRTSTDDVEAKKLALAVAHRRMSDLMNLASTRESVLASILPDYEYDCAESGGILAEQFGGIYDSEDEKALEEDDVKSVEILSPSVSADILSELPTLAKVDSVLSECDEKEKRRAHRRLNVFQTVEVPGLRAVVDKVKRWSFAHVEEDSLV